MLCLSWSSHSGSSPLHLDFSFLWHHPYGSWHRLLSLMTLTMSFQHQWFLAIESSMMTLKPLFSPFCINFGLTDDSSGIRLDKMAPPCLGVPRENMLWILFPKQQPRTERLLVLPPFPDLGYVMVLPTWLNLNEHVLQRKHMCDVTSSSFKFSNHGCVLAKHWNIYPDTWVLLLQLHIWTSMIPRATGNICNIASIFPGFYASWFRQRLFLRWARGQRWSIRQVVLHTTRFVDSWFCSSAKCLLMVTQGGSKNFKDLFWKSWHTETPHHCNVPPTSTSTRRAWACPSSFRVR